jgi:hypothetical protein
MSNIYDTPAYREGMSSYLNKDSNYKNPYLSGTPEYNAFERGWTQALKRNPDLVSRRIQYTYKANAQIKPIEDLNLKKAKEDYLKSKGY